MKERVLIFGASGYTGTALITALHDREDVEVFAHLRVGSRSKSNLEALCRDTGVSLIESDWNSDAIDSVVADTKPTIVFSVLGTTKKRKRAAEDKDAETYHAVDYGLTAMAIRACSESGTSPTFVYLSSAGVSENPIGEYLRTRLQAEKYLLHSELPYIIARPSFISGSDREEFRPTERIGAVAADIVLGAAGLIGFVGARDKYQSMTAPELAAALISITLDEKMRNVVVEARDLRKRIQ